MTSPRARIALARALGSVAWVLDARHRRVACDNVHLAYGEHLSPLDARQLARASMHHFARVALETLAFPRNEAEVPADVRVDGFEHLRTAHARGRGVIGFTGHLGHWELAALTLGRLGMPVTAIVRPLDNPYLDRRLTHLRTLFGNRVLGKRGAFPTALRILRAGGFVVTLIDQRPKRGGLRVPFFQHDAFTTKLVARLALHSGAPILPGFAVLEPDGSWRFEIEPEVSFTRTGNPRADDYRVTAACTAILERWVRRYPEQWLWMHGRWKTPHAERDVRPADGRAPA